MVDVWPFLTERARERAPRVLEYAAAATGSAALVSPQGEVVLSHVSEDVPTGCVHRMPVCNGWHLVVASAAGMSGMTERLRKAAHVLSLALTDAPRPASPNGAQGAPALASAHREHR